MVAATRVAVVRRRLVPPSLRRRVGLRGCGDSEVKPEEYVAIDVDEQRAVELLRGHTPEQPTETVGFVGLDLADEDGTTAEEAWFGDVW